MIVAASAYHSYDDQFTNFNKKLDAIINELPNDHDLIMGNDINEQLGICDCDEYSSVLVPWGVDKRNKKGRDLLAIYLLCNLRVMNTHLEHPHYVMSELFNKMKTKCMLDVAEVSSEISKNVN